MGKKGVTFEEKRTRMLNVFYTQVTNYLESCLQS